MTIGTIKSLDRTERGGWSVKLQDGGSYLCMKGLEGFQSGDKVEFDPVQKIAQKSGKPYVIMGNPRNPESKPAGTPPTINPNNKDWSIFVTGIVGRAMGSGKFTAEDIKGLSEKALQAWIEIEKRHKLASQSIIDDELPY